MNILLHIKSWGDRHHPRLVDLVRMLLGLFLVAKGYAFLQNSAYLRYLIVENRIIRQSPDMIMAIIYYTTYIHIAGGIAIFLGLFTRLWAFLQLPVILGAIFLVNIVAPFFNVELWLSILVLALLLLFIIIGSGPWSLDYLLARSRNK